MTFILSVLGLIRNFYDFSIHFYEYICKCIVGKYVRYIDRLIHCKRLLPYVLEDNRNLLFILQLLYRF